MRGRHAVVWAVIVGAPALAHADPTATSLAADANALAARGDFAGAAAKFEDANAMSPRIELLCNIGVAYDKAKDLPRAHRFLSECVQHGATLDAKFIGAVRETLAGIDKELHVGSYAEVDVRVDPADAVLVVSAWGEREKLTGSQQLWLAFGTYHLSAHAAGYRDEQRDVTVSSASVPPVEIHLVADRVTAPPMHDEPTAHASRTPVYVGAAVTGVAALATLATYFETRSKINAVEPDESNPKIYDGERDTARHWRDGFYASAAITVVAAGMTGYLWHRSSTELTIAPTGTGATAMLVGRF
jgi:hypothetical protein